MHDLCVVFDIDDTLYLERDYVVGGFGAVGEWAATWLGIEHFGTRCFELFEAGHRGSIFDAALQVFGVTPNPELISGLVALYRTHHPNIELAPDVAQAVGAIRDRWPIAVISDGPVTAQSRKAEALHLAEFASPIILTGIHGGDFHKPHPRAFELVASRIVARKYVYIADNPGKDFNSPQQLGWHSVRIRRPAGLHFAKANNLVTPDFELPDCRDLGRALACLAG